MQRREPSTSSNLGPSRRGVHILSPHRARLRIGAGFTIVELLIVVVVIAILAAICLVSYNWITGRATEASLKSELKSGATQLEVAKDADGSYPPDASGLKHSDGTSLSYAASADSFCRTASASGRTFHITSGGTITEGACPLPVATTMQTFTAAHCAALPVFTGANTSAIRSLTDDRGGTTRAYDIAKLADGKCWMLTNLKLGSTTGSITLTPSDSDTATNFTLPQVRTGGSTSYDTPTVSGPVPGETGSGTTNYGYLYNWPAATAGESRTTMPVGSGKAAHSICPAGWRLPTGGTTTSDFRSLDISFGGTGNGGWSGQANIAQWQPSGPLRTAFAGYWLGSFYDQGSWGCLWSASAHPSSASGAFSAYFDSSGVGPGNGYFGRNGGLGVRCLVK